nr:hypothetical protein [Tanacetum cinerariifolium]
MNIAGRSLSRLLTLRVDQTSRRFSKVGIDSSQWQSRQVFWKDFQKFPYDWHILKSLLLRLIFSLLGSLKNELRKLKGNSLDTKFAKASILGKLSVQPFRNHSVVRQPNALESKRPRISKPWFASQVDVKNDLSKTVTPHYFPKVIESVFAKPYHEITHVSSRNSSKESYGSNDMAHNYYLGEARKKTQDRNGNLKPRDMASARTHHTPNACTPKHRNISRSLHVSKSSRVTLNVVPLVDHSRKSSSFSNSKHFLYSTCQKCVFTANHDACVTKFLTEDNSLPAVVTPKPDDSTSTPSTASLDQDAPSSSTSQTTQQSQSQDTPLGAAEKTRDIEVARMNNDPLYGIPIPKPDYEKSFSMDVILTNVHSKDPPLEHIRKWTKDHPLDNYGLETSDPVDTLMVEKSKLNEDPHGKEFNPIRYRGMIGSLMY